MVVNDRGCSIWVSRCYSSQTGGSCRETLLILSLFRYFVWCRFTRPLDCDNGLDLVLSSLTRWSMFNCFVICREPGHNFFVFFTLVDSCVEQSLPSVRSYSNLLLLTRLSVFPLVCVTCFLFTLVVYGWIRPWSQPVDRSTFQYQCSSLFICTFCFHDVDEDRSGLSCDDRK